MQYLRRCRIRAYGQQTARIPRSSRVYAARSAPELREWKNSTEFFRLVAILFNNYEYTVKHKEGPKIAEISQQ